MWLQRPLSLTLATGLWVAKITFSFHDFLGGLIRCCYPHIAFKFIAFKGLKDIPEAV